MLLWYPRYRGGAMGAEAPLPHLYTLLDQYTKDYNIA